MGAAGGRWKEAHDSAAHWGEVRHFGDERLTRDTMPTRGRSLLAPALLAASASDRPIVIVSDGEIEDLQDIPPDLLARSAVQLFPESRSPIWRLRVSGPSRVSAGDSIPLELQVQNAGASARDSIRVEVVAGSLGWPCTRSG